MTNTAAPMPIDDATAPNEVNAKDATAPNEVNAKDATYRALLRRYPSVGMAVRANDLEALTTLASLLEGGIPADMADQLLWSGASTITPPIAAFLVERGARPRLRIQGREDK